MNTLWLQSGGCGGCRMSLLCADTVDFHAQLADSGIALLWHPSLSEASGATVQHLLEDLIAERRPLDALGHPRFYADHLAHHGCHRNEFYEFKASAEAPSERGCMMENLGCKGTQAHADCNIRLWNREGSCTRGGYACISCTEPGFQDPGHTFDQTPKLAGIPIGLPTDMPKAWFVALASLSKSATPRRVKINATADNLVIPPQIRRTRLKP